jgi:hypothetical protein
MLHRSNSLQAIIPLAACLVFSPVTKADIFIGVDFPATPDVDFPGFPSATVNVGSTVTADIRITGLDQRVVSAFEISLAFSSSILQVQSVSHGSGLNLGNPADSSWFVSTPPGAVDTQEVSFLATSILQQFQPNDLVLFSVTFLALANGTSPLDFSNIKVINGAGVPFTPAASFDGSVTAVPEPATLAVASAVAVLGFASWRRLRKH